MRRRLTTGLLAATLLGAACGDDGGSGKSIASGSAEDQLSVVANFYPLYEAVREVGGDVVEARNLTPAGSEPHDLELTPRQVDQILDADLVVYLGRGFQPAVEKIVKKRDGASLDVLAGLDLDPLPAGHEGESEEERADHEHGAGLEGGLDPHVWLDPTLMAAVVGKVETALAEAEPALAGDFARNARVYRGRLEDLDAQFTFGLKDCERREMLTSHAAFGYLARRYDLEQHGISGLSPEAEPDPDRLADLADEIEASGATTVFSETLASPRVAETLAKETGAQTAVLNPLEGLSDKELKAGETYITVMQNNLAALKKALGCAN